MIYADQRWIGNHGIGRFARHVLSGLIYQPVPLTSSPASPLDSCFLAQALRHLGSGDAFFSPGYNAPLFGSSRVFFTIHDLNHVQCPENRRPLVRLYYETVMKRACYRAARVLTVSEFTRRQIIAWSGVSPEKVVNVGNGVERTFCPDGDSYPLPFPYLLSVSNRRPHKNEFRIVEAFAKAKLDSQIHLVFTGQVTGKLGRWIDAHQVTSRVDFVGMVSEEKLPSLYRGAEALIFPSLYEGFGLPIVEAMACGTPVLTSNITAMPEVAGNAALLVDPRSVEQLSRAMREILDKSLRRELCRRGLVRATAFSWQTTSDRVHGVLCNTA